ncbi:hypothetical protein MMC34_001801 [Xylographa carneopallida]|nr:hypothetical protein [Xylographa carneopallida]
MTYTTPYGEAFKMDCGKRHGTQILSWMIANNLKECMDACGGFIACHSVDFQYRTKKCYLGAHHGNPSITATGFDSAHSVGCAGACGGSGGCSVLGGSSFKSDNAQKAGSGPPVPDLSCNNQGFEYAVYPSTNADGTPITIDTTDGYWSNFDPTVFKSRTPQASGKATTVGLSDCNTIYGTRPADPSHVAIDHRGYLFAQQDGNYTFSIPSVDDIILLWLGSLAYAGWTRPNANLVQTYPSRQQPLSWTIKLSAGRYYPLRLMFANGNGPGNFKFRLTAPDGTVIIGDEAVATTPFLVQFSCDNTTAPKFPAWGSES